MTECDICKREWDEQFLTTYSQKDWFTNPRKQGSIRVCEECDTACVATEDGYEIEYDGTTWNQ
jgi:hypothetical protein